MKPLNRILFICAAATAYLITSGCDWDDDPNHKPPAGKGSIFIDNGTSDNINVFINGSKTNRVGDFDDRAYDLNPGVYRVVLDGDHSDRSFRDDVDVLEGQLTILDVSNDPFNFDEFDVRIFFERP